MKYIELEHRALAFVQKDVELHNNLVQRLKESSSLHEDEEIYQSYVDNPWLDILLVPF